MRQSIALTVPNSFSSLPARPNLPTIVPSRRRIEIVRRIRIRHVHHLVGARSDTDRLRVADVPDLGLERAVVVEHLDALVATVGRVHVALCIDGDTIDSGELAGGVAPLAP